jgi:hydroxymethylpyrimidine pyrophosphatase-like HAD family hydrolase
LARFYSSVIGGVIGVVIAIRKEIKVQKLLINYNGSLCHTWTWKREEPAKINQNLAIDNPVEEKGKLLINPE